MKLYSVKLRGEGNQRLLIPADNISVAMQIAAETLAQARREETGSDTFFAVHLRRIVSIVELQNSTLTLKH